MTKRPPEAQARIDHLLSTQTIRAQARRMFDHALAGNTHFKVHPEKMGECADFVVETIKSNYPDLKIPFHSRWGHFNAGGVGRVAQFEEKLAHLSRENQVRAKIDLVVVSVLLDAGAGMAWRFREGSKEYSKSEGLAVASLHMFRDGAFSSDQARPLQADATGLKNLTLEKLSHGFQVSKTNPLVGLEGRLGLLHALATALEAQEEFFKSQAHSDRRVGHILDWYSEQSTNKKLRANLILRGVQLGLGSIWPGRLTLDGFNLGDVWRYGAFGEDWVPFHKLPQWLSYSMIEPLEAAGLEIFDADSLTGLAEYRNGGLFVDLGVLSLRDPGLAKLKHRADSELVIEWRALTLELLEQTAIEVRARLGLSKESFPLGKVLEGGTWSAGRRAAARMRQDGGPPIQIDSDGTVF